MVTATAFAQDITITGTVTDASTGEGIAGATILVQGDATKWVTTDVMGAYTISAPADAVLEVRFMGYTTQEIPVNGRSTVDVVLEMESEMLDDVIVVGYGSATKLSSVVGSASTVNKKVIANRPTANAGDALQGQVSGLQVFSSSGEPSSSVSMRLRGVNSIKSSSTPLFILDGAPVSSDVFSSLNSNDIENIVVMKDASATAIYGSRAANGVIYITTKKGARGEKPVVSLRAQYGISQMARGRANLMNSDEWFAFQYKLNPDYQMTEYQALSQKIGVDTDWMKYFFNEAAPVWSLDASVSGATEKTDYYISLGVFDQTGIAFDSGLTRYNVRTNVNSKINNWLKMGMNIGVSYQEYETTPYMSSAQNSFGNALYATNNLPHWLSPYALNNDDPDNPYIDYSQHLKDWSANIGSAIWDPFYLSEIQPILRTIARLNASTYQEITPIKGLTLKAQQSVEGYDYRGSQRALPVEDWPFSQDTPFASESFERYYQLTFTNTAEYKFDVAEKNHFTVLVGQEAILQDNESFSASSNGQTDLRQSYINYGTQANVPSWSRSEINYNSYFARATYNFDEKYFLDASWRIDGSSLFGENRRYANFYSVGAMWDIKREEWMQGASWVQDLRLKASYGTTGNSGIPYNYMSYGTVGAYGSVYGGAAWGVSTPPNPDLTWETIETLNIGVSARLWNFLGVNVEFYNKVSRDMLMEIPYSYTTGYSSGWGNIADMLNRGVDVDLSFDIIQTRDIYFNVRTNFNYNYNEILSLFDGVDYYTLGNTGLRMEVGYPWGEHYYVRSAGVDPRDGMQMWYDKDGNVTKTYSLDNQVMTGKQIFAPWAGGLQLNFQYKGLYIGADFTWVAGKWVWNNDNWFLTNPTNFPTYNMTKNMLNIWTKPGDITDVPGIASTRQMDDTLLENASFLRLKNLQISYSFPDAWMKKTGFLGGARIYAIARNLFTITEYSGYDPEIDTNIQMGNYPNTREFSFGVELTF